jgi:large subunit ribosomal protein L18
MSRFSKSFVRRARRIRYALRKHAYGKPRLSVFRSERNIYAQIIDDSKGITLCSASTLEKDFSGKGSDVKAAEQIGKTIAERAKQAGISAVVFDRGGYKYHGRVKSLADGARANGLEF